MKELFSSKTFWIGIATVVAGIVLILNGKREDGIQLISTGLMAIFLRNGINKVNK